MKFIQTHIPDVILIEPKLFEDQRGYFFESFHAQRFQTNGIPNDFVQDNFSLSTQGTLRGLHYQLDPKAQGKLVRVISGEVFDVAVDIRKGSPTFLKWVGVTLSATNKHMLWIPPGFAHGFYVVSKSAEFQYKCTDYYSPTHERSLLWNDPTINIQWPLCADITLNLSEKDQAALPVDQAEINYSYCSNP